MAGLPSPRRQSYSLCAPSCTALDLRQARGRQGGDERGFRSLLVCFPETAPPYMAALGRLCQGGKLMDRRRFLLWSLAGLGSAHLQPGSLPATEPRPCSLVPGVQPGEVLYNGI